MEEQDKKNTRIFYLTLAVVLTVVAVLIVAITVARRNAPTDLPLSSSQQSSTIDQGNTDAGLEEDNKLPTFVSPLKSCTLDMDFSDTVLVFSPTMEDYRTHTAVDLSASLGEEVMAVADGVVDPAEEQHQCQSNDQCRTHTGLRLFTLRTVIVVIIGILAIFFHRVILLAFHTFAPS